MAIPPNTEYKGRFAPSPSGLLHFGSLVCAVASYLDAKANHGKWLIRIEDIDTQRCRPELHSVIIDSLASHGLLSDEVILTQSLELDRYENALEQLSKRNLIYACDCSRKQIKSRSPHYDGYCSARNLSFTQGRALRLNNKNTYEHFVDRILGPCYIENSMNIEDIILKRTDHCFAYNLVVVLDDIYQGISHVVRGADLLETTTLQMYLHRIFDAPLLQYAHIPVASTKPGFKLSKQNHAKEIDPKKALNNLVSALIYLGFSHEQLKAFEKIETLLCFAIDQWRINLVAKEREFIISGANDVYSDFISESLAN
ncbi:tRNA glutamyl-Q(34) synthetase GluQRS [Glaciecola sp. KUL10]|uniref:tRNA glutamyl-Q(34) synthetase GluQRS n=1 Tax=Glaciecola sp. (strain KUL10) TaxID=2161813 RepID=UPI000D787841|nr:tRNA glutamyl-Q(34) synthetase GluQRS [Glaciecola sp. KUL10]GBL03819.1 glutamyl-Q tRNA(Asp) synthetase [Glaciecola sp. KUL10]